MNIQLRKAHLIIWLLILAGGIFLFSQYYMHAEPSHERIKVNSARFTNINHENIDLIIDSYPSAPGLSIYFSNSPDANGQKHFIRTVGQLGRYILNWDFQSKYILLYDDINGNFLESIEIKDNGI